MKFFRVLFFYLLYTGDLQFASASSNGQTEIHNLHPNQTLHVESSILVMEPRNCSQEWIQCGIKSQSQKSIVKNKHFQLGLAQESLIYFQSPSVMSVYKGPVVVQLKDEESEVRVLNARVTGTGMILIYSLDEVFKITTLEGAPLVKALNQREQLKLETGFFTYVRSKKINPNQILELPQVADWKETVLKWKSVNFELSTVFRKRAHGFVKGFEERAHLMGEMQKESVEREVSSIRKQEEQMRLARERERAEQKKMRDFFRQNLYLDASEP